MLSSDLLSLVSDSLRGDDLGDIEVLKSITVKEEMKKMESKKERLSMLVDIFQKEITQMKWREHMW